MGQVALAIQAIQRGRGAVEAAFHRATQDEMGRGGAVVGAAALVFASTAAEFRVRGDHRLVPAAALDE